jgi:hypothetical protein
VHAGLGRLGLREVGAWHLVGKRGVKADLWKRGGLMFDSGWWGLILRCEGGGHGLEAMRWWIEGEGGQ